jgi:LuxR family transcriptional regulator, maltose regulon positive regulatory protein
MPDRPIAVPAHHGGPLIEGETLGRARAVVTRDLPFGHVPRKRLTDIIDAPYQADVTIIVAGPGAGKTALAAEWARQTTMPVAWVAFGGDVSDAASLAAAIDRAVSEALGRDADDPPQRSTRVVSNIISTLDRDLCLVIDDCESIPDDGCLSLIGDLLTLHETPLHLLLIGRKQLPLRLGRLRAHGRVREIGSDDLTFTQEEASAVLRALAPGSLDDGEIDRITAHAEGWIAGIVLLGIAARDAAERGVGGSVGPEPRDAYLDEYVQQEILAPMSSEVREFVLATCELDWLSAEVCDAALGSVGSAEMLASLHEVFPFVKRDSVHPDRCRYHRLVRASLRRLARAAVPERDWHDRVRRASAWLIERGEMAAAAELALAADGSPWALETLVPVCRHLADRSDFEELGRWLRRVSDAVIDSSLDLAYWRIVAMLGLCQVDGVAPLVEELAPRALAAGDAIHVGRLSLARGLLGLYAGEDAEAEVHLRQAVDVLPDDALVERLLAETAIGQLAFQQGHDEAAAVASRAAEAQAARLPLDELWSWYVLAPDRANAYAMRGDLFSAITKYRLILSEIPASLEGTGIEPFIRCRLVSLYIERNDIDAARQELERFEELRTGESLAWHRGAIVARARLLLAAGRRDEAERWASDNLKFLRRLPEKNQLVHLLARIWLERGEYPLVESWLADVDSSEYPWARVLGDINLRILAISLDLVRERFEDAVTAIERMMAEAVATQRWAEVIPLMAHLAIALHQLGREEQAAGVWRQALQRGVSGGFIRGFSVPGFDTASLFADVLSEQKAFLPIQRGLQDIAGNGRGAEPVAVSKRELEVLRLVAEGRTNQQIAASMFISTNTVRNHLVRIGQRLQAHNRQEAVTRARQLGILD